MEVLELPARRDWERIDEFEGLYGHYEQTFALWEKASIAVPPCFIIVCDNTSTLKLVSGFFRENADGCATLINRCLELFRNLDEHGNALARPDTLLIDSEQLDSGEALDKHFCAGDQIERFRREIVVEYADVLSIPFDFTTKPVPIVPPPLPRRETVLRAITSERDACEFPRRIDPAVA